MIRLPQKSQMSLHQEQTNAGCSEYLADYNFNALHHIEANIFSWLIEQKRI